MDRFRDRIYAVAGQLKPEEVAGIIKDFNEPGTLAPTGLFVGGTKYMVIQGEPGVVIRGKKGASVVTSTTSAGIQLLPEKHCADEACGAMARSNGPEGVPVVTSADDPPTRADIPFLCNSVDETCEATGDGSAPLDAQICTGFSKLISLEVKKGLQKCATFPPSSGQPQQEDCSCSHVGDGLTGAPAF
ncbi:hypothetical protein ZEAMMB73_Zm00001d053631 [Zea mays]|uniref:Profilin n=1 Tax=Zea mays TaxID=4577 RepID=A0A1D6QR53_MAIZE|nr:hypothetical protein ZEAMMB73_Zm00001d053631 [Zea mays]